MSILNATAVGADTKATWVVGMSIESAAAITTDSCAASLRGKDSTFLSVKNDENETLGVGGVG